MPTALLLTICSSKLRLNGRQITIRLKARRASLAARSSSDVGKNMVAGTQRFSQLGIIPLMPIRPDKHLGLVLLRRALRLLL